MGDNGPSHADLNPAFYPKHATTVEGGPDAPAPGEPVETQNPTDNVADPSVADDEGAGGDSADGDEYDGMTNAELQDELRNQGKPTSGNKDELLARLRE